jgi:anti-sigma factor ChrR (cupin superfamily)
MTSGGEETAAMDALGLLPDADDGGGESGAGAHEADAAAFREVAAALAWSAGPIEPPPALRVALLARVGAPRPAVSPSLTFVMNDEGWRPHPFVEGIRLKQLALDERRGVATLLLEVAPGTVYPAHHHHGAEECYVISGDVVAAGRHLHAGDFHHADGGSDHEPLRTVGGCTVLLVVDARDYLG